MPSRTPRTPETMKTASFSKYIRPVVVIWVMILISYVVIVNPDLNEAFVRLLEGTMALSFTSYFIGRSSEKILSLKEGTKRMELQGFQDYPEVPEVPEDFQKKIQDVQNTQEEIRW